MPAKKEEQTTQAIVYSQLKKGEENLQIILPQWMDPGEFISKVVDSVKYNEKLRECDINTIVNCARTAAKVGLPVDDGTGRAFLVPRRNKHLYGQNRSGMECTLLFGYKGLVELAYRNPLVSSISVHVVYQDDEFSIELGDDPKILHKPNLCSPKNYRELTFVYIIINLSNGDKIRDYMSRQEIEDIKANAMKMGQGFSPWKSHFVEMARKTILRRLSKLIPTSKDSTNVLAIASAKDEESEYVKVEQVKDEPDRTEQLESDDVMAEIAESLENETKDAEFRKF